MSKIQVPEGGFNAVRKALWKKWGYESELDPANVMWDNFEFALEAFCRWLSENPIVPSDEQTSKLLETYKEGQWRSFARDVAVKWQKIIFNAPEPEVPEAIKDLLVKETAMFHLNGVEINRLVLEIYRRGQSETPNPETIACPGSAYQKVVINTKEYEAAPFGTFFYWQDAVKFRVSSKVSSFGAVTFAGISIRGHAPKWMQLQEEVRGEDSLVFILTKGYSPQ
jgi:hypothetical protein